MSNCKKCHKKEVYTRAKKNNYFRHDNKERCKKFRKGNPEYFKKYSKDYVRKRSKTDKVYVIQRRVSCQVYQMVKGLNLSKDSSFWKSMPYTPDDLLQHLITKFWYGMEITNYGDWHIDHIKPKSKFNIKEYGDEQFMKCWELANLQPLWKEDNLIKGDYFQE